MKSYRPKQKFKKTRSIIALVIVAIVALVLVCAGIGIALTEKREPLPDVSGVQLLSEKLGATADFSKVFVRVTYNDGSYRDVPLSELMPKNLDVSKEGRQNITVSYGNKEYTIPIDVVLTEIKISYVTSGIGGKIVGELNQSVPAGEDGSQVEARPDEGYEFANWSIDGSTDPVRRETAVSKDMEIRATFVKQEFIVTFIDAKGTSVERIVKYGESASPIPSEPGNLDSSLKRYGYEFVGWDTEEYKNVKRDMTVRAVMKKVSANYIVDTSMLGQEPMARKVITDTNILTDSLNGENLSEAQNGAFYRYNGIYQWNTQSAIQMRPEKDRTFVRWEIRGTDSNGVEQWLKLVAATPGDPNISGTLYLKTSADGDRTAVMFTSTKESDGTPSLRFVLPTGTEILEVRAIMAKTKSVITFKSLSETVRVLELPFGQALTAEDLAAPAAVTGYNFAGWRHEDGSLVNELYTESFYQDTILTAQLDEKTIYISFTFPDTPLVQDVQQEAKYGTSLGQGFPDVPEREHFRFMRWRVTHSLNSQLIGTTFSSETQVTDDITVSPEYQKITYHYTVLIQGQGLVTYQKDGQQPAVAGSQIIFESGEDYVLGFEPQQGYSVQEYTVSFDSGKVSLNGVDNTVLVNDVAENGQISVVFVPQNHTISIQNGTQDQFGSIAFLTQTFTEHQISFGILHGVPLKLEIKAPEGMRILSIKVDGNAKEFLPTGIHASYNFAYESLAGTANVEGDVAIVITYTALEFAVTAPQSPQNGTAQLFKKTDAGFDLSTDTSFTYGTHLKLVVAAENGYYIENLSIWGKSIDFYQYYYETYSDDLFDSSTPYFLSGRARRGFQPGDNRVTHITLYIPSANKSTDIAVKFGKLEFKVEVEVDGFGNATLAQNSVYDNGSVSLTLKTEASYAFLSYRMIHYSAETPIEGAEIPSQSKESEQEITIGNIVSDIKIIVKFGRRSYSVLFPELDPNSKVSYLVQSANQSGTVDANRTFSEVVNHGTNAVFTLVAQSGYQLKEILLLDGQGNNIPAAELPFENPIVLPNNTLQYNLVLNGIMRDYIIKVELTARNYEVRLDTNVVTKDMATLEFSEQDSYGDKLFPSDARPSVGSTETDPAVFSYPYGKELTLTISKQTDFSVLRLVVNGQVYSSSTTSVTFTVTGDLVIELLLEFTASPGTIVVRTDKNQGDVSYRVENVSQRVASSIAQTNANQGKFAYRNTGTKQRVTYTPVAKTGYQLKTLYVNAVAVKLSNDGKYLSEFDPTADAHFVTAVFEKMQLSFDFVAANGTLLSEKNYVLYGESATVYVTAETGYELTSLKINGRELPKTEVDAIKANGFIEILGTDTIGQNVEVVAKFSPLPYQMEVAFAASGDGDGRIIVDDDLQNAIHSGNATSSTEDVVYGRQIALTFEADPGSFIAEITINGDVIELNNMFDTEIKAANGKYAKGKLAIEITGNAKVEVRFDTDVFRINVADSEGGSVSLRSDSNKEGNEFGANEKITVTMIAIAGYHIVGLTINNVAQTINFNSNSNPNLNTKIEYQIPNGLLVRNLLVSAEFARNAYAVTVDIANISPNFKAVDNTVDRYASIVLNFGGSAVTGNGTTDVQNAKYNIIFPGIEHGGTPQLKVEPRVASGYEIDSAKLYYVAEFGGAQMERTLQFSANSDYTESFSAMYWDARVEVRVRRKMVSATVARPVVKDGNLGAVQLTSLFFAGDKVATQWQEPITQASGAKTYFYEYGVRAEVGIRLQAGYKITEFKFNGQDQTHIVNGALQNNVTKFTTALTQDSNFTIAAEIRYILVQVSGSGEGTGSFRINNEATNQKEVSVPYNTAIRLAIFAASDEGSYIEAIFINGVRKLDPNAIGYTYEFAAIEDIEIRIQFAMYYYDLKLGEQYPAMPDGIQSYSYNGTAANNFRWGTKDIKVEIEIKEGYDFKGILLNGELFTDYFMDGRIVTFVVPPVKSDYIILPKVERKMFSVSAVHSDNGETKFYDKADKEIINDINLKTVGYGDNIYIILKPNSGYYPISYAVLMEDLQGNLVSKEYPISKPNKTNTDIIRIDIEALTGKIEVVVTYQLKIYNIISNKPAAEAGTVTIGRADNETATTTVEWGVGFKVTVKPKNGYDIRSFVINGYEYYLESLESIPDHLSVMKLYDPVSRTYTYEYSFTATEGVMNGHNGIIGSDTRRELKIVVMLEKNMYSAESVLLQYLDPATGGTTETELEIPIGGTVQHDRITIETFNTLREGTSFAIKLNMQIGYSALSLSVRQGHQSSSGLQESVIASLQDGNFTENNNFESIAMTASTAYADMSSPYRKQIHLVVKITKNTYDATFGVRTIEKNKDLDEKVETIIGANGKVVAKLVDDNTSTAVTTDAQLSRVIHGITVQLTANSIEKYSFKGFETRKPGSAVWVPAEDEFDINGDRIVIVDGVWLTVVMTKKFEFRAVYCKQVTVDVVFAPYHKYMSGNYTSGFGENMTFLTYAEITALVNGNIYPATGTLENGKGVKYTFDYNTTVQFTAEDKQNGTQNRSTKARYLRAGYANGEFTETKIESVGAVGDFQLRFVAKEEYKYDPNLETSTAMYVAFDNDVKLNSVVETNGGMATDGGSVVYQKKNASNQYEPLQFNNRTANVQVFDRIRITVTVNDGYRFDVFNRMTGNSAEPNFKFTGRQLMAEYKNKGLNSWEPNYTTNTEQRIKMSYNGSNRITIDLIVIENSIYEFLFTKVYTINSFISMPKYVGDTDIHTDGVSVNILSGNKSFFNDATKEGQIDYGAWIELELNPNYEWLKDSATSKHQFIGWYANRKNATNGGNEITTYPGAWQAKQRVQLTADTGYASSEKTAKELQIYAEFMPMYQIQSHEYYKVGNTTFTPTVSFNMYSHWYSYNDVTGTGASSTAPSNRLPLAVNKDATIGYYLPFNAQKELSGLPAAAVHANKVTLTAIVNNSYTLIKWLIFYGNYNQEVPNYDDGIQIAGNNQDVEFVFTKEHYDKMPKDDKGFPTGAISIVPVFNKQNAVRVSKKVFYNEYGTDTTEGRNENIPGYRTAGGGFESFSLSEAKKLNFGDTLTLVANAHSSYRFIGWFDASKPNNAPQSEAVSTASEYQITMDKESDTDYTYSYEARYIRQVQLNISSVNNSGVYVNDDSPKFSDGNKTMTDKYFYSGVDVVKNQDPTKLFNLSELGAIGAASTAIRADVGSYVLFRLVRQKDTSTGFDPEYDRYVGISTDNAATAVTEADDAYYVVCYMISSRTFEIKFKTFGTVTLSGLLDRTTFKLGATLSKTLYDQYGNDTQARCFNSAEVSSVVYENGRFTVVMNASNETGKINIKGVEKKDFRSDTIDYTLNGFSAAVALNEPFSLNFGGNASANKMVTFNMSSMPFGSGGGTAARPYMLNNLTQFDKMDAIFKLNNNDMSGVYFKLGANLTLNGATSRFGTGNGFNGNLNGDGKTITVSGAFTANGSSEKVGLFEQSSGATIENIVFTSSSQITFAKTTANAGLVVADAKNTTFRNLTFNGINVSAQAKTFGLIAGVMVGGAVQNASILNLTASFNNGIGATGDFRDKAKGGFVGIATNAVLSGLTYKSNTTSVSKMDSDGLNVGGFVGLLKGEDAQLTNSTLYSGLIVGLGSIGGAVGRLERGKIESVSVQLEAGIKNRMQIRSTNVAGPGANNYDAAVISVDASSQYAAGGIVGANYLGTVTNCFVKSNNQATEATVGDPNGAAVVNNVRYIPTVSILGSLSGGIVGVNQNVGTSGATLSHSYIEQNTLVELIMYDGKSIAGGLIGMSSEASKVYNCGINGLTTNAYQADQSLGGVLTQESYAVGVVTNNNPFRGKTSSNTGLHYQTNVEFVLWQGASSLSSEGYMRGAMYFSAHSGESTTGAQAVSVLNGTVFMGGLVGVNRGDIINSYVSGKISHFRRQVPSANATMYYLLGGLVGNNIGNLFGSGIFDAAVYGFARLNSRRISGQRATIYTTSAGIAGTSGTGLYGGFVKNTAVRSVLDPWKEGVGNAHNIDSTWALANHAAGFVSAVLDKQASGYLSFVQSGTIKTSAGSETVANNYNDIWRWQCASPISINPTSKDPQLLPDNKIVRSSIADLTGASVAGQSGSTYFYSNGIRKLTPTGAADGNKNVWGLGNWAAKQVCSV